MGPGGGHVQAIVSSSSEIWTGLEYGGIFRSTNHGLTWKASSTGLPNLNVTSIFIIHNSVFVSSSVGLLRSTDGGTHWMVADSGLPNANTGPVVAIDSMVLLGFYPGGMFRSTDNGLRWTEIDSGLPSNAYVSRVLLRPQGDLFIFVQYPGNGLYYSSDKGDHWFFKGLQNKSVTDLTAIDSVVVVSANNGEGIFRSTDNGEHWLYADSGLTDYSVWSITHKGSVLYAGTQNNGIFISTDYGLSWTASSAGIPDDFYTKIVTSLGIDDSNVYAGMYTGGIFRSSNNGASWQDANIGLSGTFIRSVVSDNFTVLAGTDELGIFRTTDSGLSWSRSDAGLSDRGVAVLGFGENDFFASTWHLIPNAFANSLYHSIDMGNSWTKTNFQNSCFGISIIPHYILVSTGFEGFWYSPNKGETWTSIGGSYAQSIAGDSNSIFVGTYDGVYELTNSMHDWVNKLSLTDVRSLLYFDSTLIAGTSTGNVFISTDNGSSWMSSSNPSWNIMFTVIHWGATLFVGTATGVYVSTDLGMNWHAINDGLTNPIVRSLTIANDNLFAGTEHGGVWRRPLSEIITSVNDNTRPGKVIHFELKQNYPNPFNPNTTIQFSLPKTAHTTLQIFNLLGQRVATVFEGILSEGDHSITWNPTSSGSGVYLYKITSGMFSTTKKMLLLK
jgi:photosystem II stability/assembly factor-like uncharacterized protein